MATIQHFVTKGGKLWNPYGAMLHAGALFVSDANQTVHARLLSLPLRKIWWCSCTRAPCENWSKCSHWNIKLGLCKHIVSIVVWTFRKYATKVLRLTDLNDLVPSLAFTHYTLQGISFVSLSIPFGCGLLPAVEDFFFVSSSIPSIIPPLCPMSLFDVCVSSWWKPTVFIYIYPSFWFLICFWCALILLASCLGGPDINLLNLGCQT